MPRPLPPLHSGTGPLVAYLNRLYASPEPGHVALAKETREAIRRVARTEDGAILLDLLEKATTHYFLPPGSDAGACDALNAQRFIALDLRRIVSDEAELAEKDDAGAGRGRRR